MMELSKLRSLGAEELKAQQAQAGEQLFRIRFQKSLGNQEGLKKLRSLKLEIAQAKTIERERQIEADRAANPVQKPAAPSASQRTARKKAKGR